MAIIVSGVFNDATALKGAVNALLSANLVLTDEISVLAKGGSLSEGIAGQAYAIAMPGVGALVASGAIVEHLVKSYVHSIAEALEDYGIISAIRNDYEREVRQGKILAMFETCNFGDSMTTQSVLAIHGGQLISIQGGIGRQPDAESMSVAVNYKSYSLVATLYSLAFVDVRHYPKTTLYPSVLELSWLGPASNRIEVLPCALSPDAPCEVKAQYLGQIIQEMDKLSGVTDGDELANRVLASRMDGHIQEPKDPELEEV